MSQEKSIVWKGTGNGYGEPRGWVGWVSGNNQGESTVIARLMDSQERCQSAGSVGGKLSKEQEPLPALLSGEKVTPPAHVMKPDNSVFPYMSLAPF